MLGADDFGVLPFKPAKVRADNDRFANHESEAGISAAMTRVVEVGLFIEFIHQGQRFACDPLWQDFQKIQYPRRTYYPAPCSEIFVKLSEKTQELFRKHSNPPRGEGHRLKAKGKRLTANGKRLRLGGESEGRIEPVVALSTNGARGVEDFLAVYPNKRAKEYARKVWKKLNPDPALITTIFAAIEKQRQTDAWLKEDGKYIPLPASWLNGRRWEDEVRLASSPVFTDVTQRNIRAAQNVLDRMEERRD